MLIARNYAVLLFLLNSVFFDLVSRFAEAQDPGPSTTQANDLFENHIRPTLVARCIKCHGPAKSESGLRLDRIQSLLAGGDSGPALIPGDAAGSLLLSVLDHQYDIKMPPDKPLNEIEIQAFKQWISAGAHWPDQVKLGNGTELRSGPPTEAELAFWAFQPLQGVHPPALEKSSHINNDIDRFVQAKLAEQSLSANPPADKQTLVRRIAFDLTGLPPSPEAIDHFMNDSSSDALERLVDRLLASQAYGERWGRHWLDVVRYSDTAGETADYPVPDAWRYRNYVIDAFNQDKPYDRFLREQIAGDVLAYQDVRSHQGKSQEINSEDFAELITATGFIAIARRFGFDSENYHHLTIQDTIDTVGQATLGLSIGCARCHDHKFDPISMDDYYALYGIFESTLYPLAGSEQKQKVRSLVPLQPDISRPDAASRLTQSNALKQKALRKLGRAVPPVVLRSLTELDGDFELQSPAAGGSRGVLVGHWLFDGPISVTNAAQSPFVDAFPKGKVGVAFPAGHAMAGIWQALNHRSLDPSRQPLSLSFDFRVGPANTASSTQTNKPTDQAADLATTAKSLAATKHHGLRVDLCGNSMQVSIGLLVGESDISIQVGEQVMDLGKVEANKWYNIELTIVPALKTVRGHIAEHNASSSSFERQVSGLPNEVITRLRVQTSRVLDKTLPTFELDNISVIPDKLEYRPNEALQQLVSLGDVAAMQAELKSLTGIGGDFESQVDGQPPAKPFHPGPNSVVKIAKRSQSPFLNYYDEGSLGVHMPNRAEYDGFGQQLENVKPNEAGHLLASFDFCCASHEAGGSGSWRYYLGHGPGNSAALELFFNGNQFFRRSADARDPVTEIDIGKWYQVQLDFDLKNRSYSGKLVSADSSIAFSGQVASGWDGTIDYTFIDSYGHIGGVRPALDVDNFSLGQVPRNTSSDSASESQTTAQKRRERAMELRIQLASMQASAELLEKQLLAPPVGMSYAVIEGTPHDVPIQIRGEPSQPGKLVARRMPQLFRNSRDSAVSSSRELTGSGRLDLANWITDDAKQLAARVMVNRVWQQHFGRGLVRTENDFGTRGELPTHPELLDWLAGQFIESGWSIKQLHRLIIRSATYQKSSQPNQLSSERDPENRWLWRFSPRRLSAEEIRDAMLQVSGKLDTSMGGEHPFPAPQTWGFTQHSPFYAVYETNRRSVYLMQQRIKRHPFLALFDGADPNVSTARRETTIVPTQALYLMNNPFVHEVADKLSETCVPASSSSEAIKSLYVRCLGRPAKESEIQRASQFMDRYIAAQSQIEPASDQRRRSAWAALARTLITRNEFLFVE